MSNYLKELSTIQTLFKSAAGLPSWRVAEMSPKLSRPVVLFEAPNRKKDRELSRESYVMRVQQFGKLYVTSVDNLATYQEQLITALEDACNLLEVMDGEERIAYLKNVELEFEDTDTLDVTFSITYEATYGRPVPAAPPPATFVGTRMIPRG